MKDAHLIDALLRAARRYGSHAGPSDANALEERAPRTPARRLGLRTPGWVSVGEIDACQSPNSYPRLGRREIRQRCEALAREGGSPVRGVRRGSGGLRTWVLVKAPPTDGPPPAPGGADDRSASAAPATGGVPGGPGDEVGSTPGR